MTIEIEALDTLIFQDGKPFDKSGDNWGNSLLLPTPSTLYGALRATYFANDIDELSKANEDDDPTKNLKINFIGLKYQEKLIFAIPKDCVESKGEVKTLDLEENLLTNSPLKYTFFSKDEIESIDKGYLKNSNFKRYLSGKTIGSFEVEDSLVIKENKIGIGLNRQTKTTGEGLLYRVEMLRYKDLKIVISFDGLDLNENGLIKLGGEAKGAKYQSLNSLDIPKMEKINSNIFKLYLLTPAIFDNGWYPCWIDKDNNFIGEFKDFKIKLIACAVGKYQSIGGFDMKTNTPKEMFKAVSIGSVYYFEILKGDKDKVIETFNLSSISDYKQKEGYGLVIIGDVK